MAEPLIQEFVDALARVREHLQNGRVQQARDGYIQLSDIYQKINASELDYHHKQIAYDQITKVHQQLDTQPAPRKIPLAPLVILLGVLFVGAGVFFSLQPGLIGLAIFESSRTMPLELTFEQDTTHTIILDSAPASIQLSGRVLGSARVWLLEADTRTLIFDSDNAQLADGLFTNECLDTCAITPRGRATTIEVDVQDGPLYLESITYSPSANRAPEWLGTIETYELHQHLQINLNTLFHDPDGDNITYLVTAADDVTTSVEGGVVTFSRTGGSGERLVTIMASDLTDITRVPLTLTLQ